MNIHFKSCHRFSVEFLPGFWHVDEYVFIKTIPLCLCKIWLVNFLMKTTIAATVWSIFKPRTAFLPGLPCIYFRPSSDRLRSASLLPLNRSIWEQTLLWCVASFQWRFSSHHYFKITKFLECKTNHCPCQQTEISAAPPVTIELLARINALFPF